MIPLAWTARLARVGVASLEVAPRIIERDSSIVMHSPNVPLTNSVADVVGRVLHVQMTEHWLYAFGTVTDREISERMRSGALAPEFSLLHGRMQRPNEGLRVITHGEIAAIRAALNRRHIVGAHPLWTGLRFTVEEP